MKKILFTLFAIAAIAFLSVVITLYLVDSSGVPNDYDIYKVQSELLAEERELIVNLPLDYEEQPTQRYPVIYVFGGNSLTFSIVNDLQLLVRTGHLPPAIVVGIPNISQKTRQRDLTPPFLKQDLDESNSPLGKADVYLDFVEQEIIPLIEKNYRSTSERLAVGHSREGLMVMYSIVEKPNLFSGVLALSPALWRQDNLFVHKFNTFLQTQDSIPAKLFLSMGDQEVKKMKAAFDLSIGYLEDHVDASRWKSWYTKNAVHRNNALLSAPIGIEWVLKN